MRTFQRETSTATRNERCCSENQTQLGNLPTWMCIQYQSFPRIEKRTMEATRYSTKAHHQSSSIRIPLYLYLEKADACHVPYSCSTLSTAH